MPIDMGDADRVLKEMYGPALREQLDFNKGFLGKLGYTPTVVEAIPRWKWLLITAKERLNACYMHLRYGACDDKKEWNEHICD